MNVALSFSSVDKSKRIPKKSLGSLNMTALCSIKTLENTNPATQRHRPEALNSHLLTVSQGDV
jgi:hypothetical protein